MTETPMFAYNQHMLEWRQDTLDYQDAAEDAARADAQFKVAEARVIVREKRNDPKIAIDLAKSYALIDDTVVELVDARLVAQAKADAIKKKLEWDKAHADNLRTNVVNDREENKLGSQFGAGPGRTTFPADQPPPSRPPAPPEQWEPPRDPLQEQPPEAPKEQPPKESDEKPPTSTYGGKIY